MDGLLDLARACAPQVQVETLAAVASVESGLHPFAIRVNSGPPLKRQPASKAEAIETAAALAAEGHDIDLGLGGLNGADLPRLGLTLSDAFEPCANLNATGRLLADHYRAAVGRGATPSAAKTAMLVAYYGRGDAEAGALAGYDRRVAAERDALRPRLSTLTLAAPARRSPPLPAREAGGAPEASKHGATPPVAADAPPKAPSVPTAPPRAAAAPRWDVFSATRPSSLLVYQPGDQP